MSEAALSEIFNEWGRRYAENPDDFGAITNDDGTLCTNYGRTCAVYVLRIVDDLKQAAQVVVEPPTES